jgi:hypothetical protein
MCLFRQTFSRTRHFQGQNMYVQMHVAKNGTTAWCRTPIRRNQKSAFCRFWIYVYVRMYTYTYIWIYVICRSIILISVNWNSTKNRGTKQIQYRSNYVVGEHKGLTHIGKWPTSWNNKDKYVHTCGPFYLLLGCKVFVRGKWVLYFCSTSSYSTLCTNRDGPNNSLQPGGGQ